jgi:Pvc16 N-terminal domain
LSDRRTIAAVTASLTELIADALTGVLPMTEVTNLRPSAAVAATDPPSVNVFLYRATPNSGLRNVAVPTRDASGRLIRRPTAAWDLYYLLTFVGDEAELEPELMLGATVTALEALPILQQGFVASVEGVLAAESGNRRLAAGSGLDSQTQLVRFTPVDLSLETMTQLWGSLTSEPYAVSVAYQASVVLMTADLVPAPSLAVAGRASVAMATLSAPRINAVHDSEGQTQPIVIASTLVIEGARLMGEHTVVRIGDLEVELATSEGTSLQIELPLSPDDGTGTLVPRALAPGVLGVQIRHRANISADPAVLDLRPSQSSNVLPIVLRPVITSPPVLTTDDDGDAAIAVVIAPDASADWEYRLLLNELLGAARGTRLPLARELDQWSFRPATLAPPAPATVLFKTAGVPSGDWLVRVQVNGADSLVTQDASGYYALPHVVLP